jgi:hypothetical protein
VCRINGVGAWDEHVVVSELERWFVCPAQSGSNLDLCLQEAKKTASKPDITRRCRHPATHSTAWADPLQPTHDPSPTTG